VRSSWLSRVVPQHEVEEIQPYTMILSTDLFNGCMLPVKTILYDGFTCSGTADNRQLKVVSYSINERLARSRSRSLGSQNSQPAGDSYKPDGRLRLLSARVLTQLSIASTVNIVVLSCIRLPLFRQRHCVFYQHSSENRFVNGFA